MELPQLALKHINPLSLVKIFVRIFLCRALRCVMGLRLARYVHTERTHEETRGLLRKTRKAQKANMHGTTQCQAKYGIRV